METRVNPQNETQFPCKVEGGIGLDYQLMQGKYARFHWLLNINQVNPE